MDIVELFIKANGNTTIQNSFAKAFNHYRRHDNIVVSVSGGKDSDIVLDIISKLDEEKKVHYAWFDTGLEYQATKDHINELEAKYDITIERIKAIKPIPTCCKQYGQPFLNKHVSEMISRLQRHNFKWENEPIDVLLKKYSNCKIALQWWCGERYSESEGISKISRFSITRNKYLKEFMVENPPMFPISAKCCEYAKKKPSKQYIQDNDIDLEITGIRKAEGGIRSVIFDSCFSPSKSKGCDTYRTVFWYTDSDEKDYISIFGVENSRCYTEYGLKRTGCVGCPYNIHIGEELSIIEKNEPKLYKAALAVFGDSYEYTRKYREFAKQQKQKEKEEKLNVGK